VTPILEARGLTKRFGRTQALAGLDLVVRPDRVVALLGPNGAGKTRSLLDERKLTGEIAHKGEQAPVQATGRWHIERTNAWHNAFGRLARCYERRESVVDAFFDLADTIITVRSLIRRAWTTHRWDSRPERRR
jgi:ABC-type branched-subunit amino acid transport system ATPase component